LERIKLLILGSEGFIGSHLVKHFLLQDYEVIGCDLFETSQVGDTYTYVKVSRLSPEWEEVFATFKPAVCINAAGSGSVPYSVQHPFSDFEANTLDTARLLDVLRRLSPESKYLHISSAAVYGNPASLPVDEKAALHPLSPYGWHKLMAENLCSEYHSIFSVPVSVIRPFSVYGAGLRKQLLWDICTKLRHAGEISLFGTGKESRDFIHVTDLAVLVDCIVRRSPFKNDIYNAASGRETTIEEIAREFERCYDGAKTISFSGKGRAGDPVNWKADIRKAGSLGFQPAVALPDGIRNYISWFHSIH
jgi:UDP-glucose 4-epimerase